MIDFNLLKVLESRWGKKWKYGGITSCHLTKTVLEVFLAAAGWHQPTLAKAGLAALVALARTAREASWAAVPSLLRSSHMKWK